MAVERDRRGGTYVMNHESFGAMMLSEQMRKPLEIVAGLIKEKAKANTLESSANAIDPEGRESLSLGEIKGHDTDEDGQHLADHYSVERGPAVVIMGQGGIPGPRISQRVVNPLRHAAAREFGRGGWQHGRGTRDLRRAGEAFGDLAGEPQ